MLSDQLANAILKKIFPGPSYESYLAEEAIHLPVGNQEMQDWTQEGQWPGSSGFDELLNLNEKRVVITPVQIFPVTVQALHKNSLRKTLVLSNPTSFTIIYDHKFFIPVQPKERFWLDPGQTSPKFDGWADDLFVNIYWPDPNLVIPPNQVISVMEIF